MLKNIFISTIFSFILIIFFFIIVETTNLFKDIYMPGAINLEDKSTYLSQGFTNEYYMKIKKEGGDVKLTKFEEYFLVNPKKTNNKYINIIDYYNSRKVTNISNINDAEYIIWFFGGSTMIELGADDDSTIASTVAVGFKNNSKKAFISNFGMSGFNSTLEKIKFLELLKNVKKSERPNEVIFYHGNNDAAYSYQFKSPSKMPTYMTKGIRNIVEQNNIKLFFFSLERIFWKSAAVINYIKNKIFKYKHNNKDITDDHWITDEFIQNAANYFLNNERIINAICLEYKIKCHFILQPSLITKKNITEIEKNFINKLDPQYIAFKLKYYDIIKNTKKDYLFYDFTNVFDEEKKYSDYSDWIHIAPLSSRFLGKEIYRILYN